MQQAIMTVDTLCRINMAKTLAFEEAFAMFSLVCDLQTQNWLTNRMLAFISRRVRKAKMALSAINRMLTTQSSDPALQNAKKSIPTMMRTLERFRFSIEHERVLHNSLVTKLIQSCQSLLTHLEYKLVVENGVVIL